MEKRSFYNRFINEYLGKAYATICGIFIIVCTLAVIFFIASNGIKTFTQNHYSIADFLFSSKWDIDDKKYGSLVYIAGSTFVSIGAVIIATPLAVCLAVFMNMISPRFGERILQPAMELFVGIPSVVYGWIGLTVLIPNIKKVFGGYGFGLLAGILVLSVMILPTITSVSSDAIKTIPKDYLEASYGLGATRWQTIKKVIIPASLTGISTGVVLGMSRAFGEALAVQMVIGNTVQIPKGLLSATSTLTSAITMDMGNTADGDPLKNVLWSMAFLLLIVSFLFILIIRFISKRREIR
ncbi:phosphate ABC transporter permease subunit PstC [Clostridium sp. 19966]|uniref:phosphate ABC transporter permease subunit PstC n=1 Tax=Clostridium sp. 19966 TaxID=2768166 RepID=UPI0028DE6CAF|nr:phosphate ABC transporter permease subunit PstC [Clostridium sp. 19966]MDT8718148.1 phosphate ABC transporter permease subunit PstC [Clostridium sp. 19966]